MSAGDITEKEYLGHMYDMERRAVAEVFACESIPTEALEAGAVEKMVELLGRLAGESDRLRDPCVNDLEIACDATALSHEARALLRQIKGDQT